MSAGVSCNFMDTSWVIVLLADIMPVFFWHIIYLGRGYCLALGR